MNLYNVTVLKILYLGAHSTLEPLRTHLELGRETM